MHRMESQTLTPLYFETIVNQFPEASELLNNIVQQCRYKQHDKGRGFNFDDYHCFIEDEGLKDVIKTVTGQASELHELQCAIRDYSKSAAELAKQNPELLQNGSLDQAAIEARTKSALKSYEKSYKIFADNIASYQKWLNENRDAFLQHEEEVAQAMRKKLEKNFDPKEAIQWVNQHYPTASPEEKKAQAKIYAKKQQEKRKNLANIYQKPQNERRKLLAEYYRHEEE